MKRNVEIVTENGKKIVVIRDIIFKGRRNIAWCEVEKYLKRFIGEQYRIVKSGDSVFIGSDFPDEFAGSDYTKRLKGTLAKAKANAVQGVPELLAAADEKRYKENLKEKHNIHAKHGWYRYNTRFALPVYSQEQEPEGYNLFRAVLLIRHAQDGKYYLYDIVNIKKETGKPFKL